MANLRARNEIYCASERPRKKSCISKCESYQPCTVDSSSKAISVNLLNLPSETLECIIRLIMGCWGSLDLDYQSFSRCAEAYSLCSNNSILYPLFRSTVDSLHIKSLSVGLVKEAGRVFGSCLRYISISGCHGIPFDLDSVLTPSVIGLTIQAGCFRLLSSVFTRLSTSTVKIRFLRLSSVVFDEKFDWKASALASAFSHITALSLVNVEGMESVDVLDLVSCPGRELRHLEIRKLSFITDVTLTVISQLCDRLVHIDIMDTPQISSAGSLELALSYRKFLRFFHYDKIVEEDHLTVVSACSNLQHITYRSKISDDSFKALCLRADRVLSLHLRYFSLSLPLLTRMANAMVCIRELVLHFFKRSELLIKFCKLLGPKLRILQVTSVFDITDEVLCAIGSCTELQDLLLNVMSRVVRYGALPSVLPSTIALNTMLKAVGGSLRKISWRSRTVWRDTLPGTEDGPDVLSGIVLAKSLGQHCRKLQHIEVSDMAPTGVSPRNYHRAFEKLRDQIPGATLYLDESPPCWFGKGLCYEE